MISDDGPGVDPDVEASVIRLVFSAYIPTEGAPAIFFPTVILPIFLTVFLAFGAFPLL